MFKTFSALPRDPITIPSLQLKNCTGSLKDNLSFLENWLVDNGPMGATYSIEEGRREDGSFDPFFWEVRMFWDTHHKRELLTQQNVLLMPRSSLFYTISLSQFSKLHTIQDA